METELTAACRAKLKLELKHETTNYVEVRTVSVCQLCDASSSPLPDTKQLQSYSYSKLVDLIADWVGFEIECRALKLTYIDRENERVVVSSTEELSFAIHQFIRANASSLNDHGDHPPFLRFSGMVRQKVDLTNGASTSITQGLCKAQRELSARVERIENVLKELLQQQTETQDSHVVRRMIDETNRTLGNRLNELEASIAEQLAQASAMGSASNPALTAEVPGSVPYDGSLTQDHRSPQASNETTPPSPDPTFDESGENGADTEPQASSHFDRYATSKHKPVIDQDESLARERQAASSMSFEPSLPEMSVPELMVLQESSGAINNRYAESSMRKGTSSLKSPSSRSHHHDDELLLSPVGETLKEEEAMYLDEQQHQSPSFSPQPMSPSASSPKFAFPSYRSTSYKHRTNR